MKIALIHTDLLPEVKDFDELTNEEVLELCEKDSMLSTIYNSIEELESDWNSDYIFDPSFSFMRIIK